MNKSAKQNLENNIADMRNRCEEDISRMREEFANGELHNDCCRAANQLHDLYMCYIDSGFTEEQAWELTKIVQTNSTKKGIL